MFLQWLLYLICLVLSLSLYNWWCLICNLFCLFKTQTKHFSENFNDFNLLTWINWCKLNLPNLLHHFFFILSSVLLFLWDNKWCKKMWFFPILFDPIILIYKLQWCMFISINWIQFVSQYTLSCLQWSFGL